MDWQEDADDPIADAARRSRRHEAHGVGRGVMRQQTGKTATRIEFHGPLCHFAPRWTDDRDGELDAR